MSLERNRPFAQLDWLTVGLYLVLVLFGWLNIYAAVYDPEVDRAFMDMSLNHAKQLVWVGLALLIALGVLLFFDMKLFYTFAYVIYVAGLLALLAVLLLGREVQGSKSWFEIAGNRLQPAEFTKFATALALARFLHEPMRKVTKWGTFLVCVAIMGLPMGLITLQGDTGSALVFSFLILVLYREGLPHWVMGLGLLLIVLFVATLLIKEKYLYHLVGTLVGLGGLYVLLFGRRKWRRIWPAVGVVALSLAIVFSVDFLINQVLKPHQRARIYMLIEEPTDKDDMKGGYFQVRQSKIAIGSGGFVGKGFLQGTQTKGNFVPDQVTDFIFSIIGEEYGWLGSVLFIAVYVFFIQRLVVLAERQKARFARVYGYGVASVIFFHFAANIAMTMGIFPVIGIPLPFISYGGSSLWAFTILLFILLRLDFQRKQQLLAN
ncbi:MAG: rod shape-determining protein RodA [Bernardetiaceae bacterium]|nr:rod shape-determining protein RodA [Bernardetiaceae bacterium]